MYSWDFFSLQAQGYVRVRQINKNSFKSLNKDILRGKNEREKEKKEWKKQRKKESICLGLCETKVSHKSGLRG